MYGKLCTEGADFIPFDDLRLTFNPGNTSICATFMVRQDDTVEGTESVNLTISSTTLQLGSPSNVILSILDSDRKLVSCFTQEMQLSCHAFANL